MLRDIQTRSRKPAKSFTAIPDPARQMAIDTAKRVDVLDLAQRYTTLQRESSHEYSGPCPKCMDKGEDRFHCTSEWWFCRICHTERGDAIEMIRWLTGVGFKEAVGMLTGVPMPTNSELRQSHGQIHGLPVKQVSIKQTPPDVQVRLLAQWQADAETEIANAQVRLLSEVGEPGREYLAGRGLLPEAWDTFRLGFSPDVTLPGTRGKERRPALTMPWTVGGKVAAIRYRFLTKHAYTDGDGRERKDVKQTAKPKAYDEQPMFSGRLFGGLGLLGVAEDKRDLFICEGELNAISIWQVAHDAAVDVLSLGSESQSITDAMLAHIVKFRHVIVWMDRTEKLAKLRERIPKATGIASPSSMDANDCLQKGTLQAMTAELRLRACADDAQRTALLWDLWDHHNLYGGVDEPTQALIDELRGRLGIPTTLALVPNGEQP
jgi:DNA primase